MRHSIVIILAALNITACASLGIGQADKREWVSVSCGGFKSWEHCKEQASRACPKGFDVAKQEENHLMQKRTMEYACKP